MSKSGGQLLEAQCSGIAALALCESMLLALVESGAFSRQDKTDILEDAISTLRNGVEGSEHPELLECAARLLASIDLGT